jgi:hypothetical protein
MNLNRIFESVLREANIGGIVPEPEVFTWTGRGGYFYGDYEIRDCETGDPISLLQVNWIKYLE